MEGTEISLNMPEINAFEYKVKLHLVRTMSKK